MNHPVGDPLALHKRHIYPGDSTAETVGLSICTLISNTSLSHLTRLHRLQSDLYTGHRTHQARAYVRNIMLTYNRVSHLAGPGDRILDVGAKGGTNIGNTVATVIAVDLEFSKPAAEEGTEYYLADGRLLPFDDQTFDYMVSNQVIEHVDGREALFAEIRRVLKPGGTVLFSFPNRIAPNKPHGLPRMLSMLPKPIGLAIGQHFLDEQQYEYYRTALFPLSPVGARRALHDQFETVEYVTMHESVRNPDVYGDRFAPRLFVSCLPVIAFLCRFTFIHLLFELVWGYVSYECR